MYLSEKAIDVAFPQGVSSCSGIRRVVCFINLIVWFRFKSDEIPSGSGNVMKYDASLDDNATSIRIPTANWVRQTPKSEKKHCCYFFRYKLIFKNIVRVVCISFQDILFLLFVSLSRI